MYMRIVFVADALLCVLDPAVRKVDSRSTKYLMIVVIQAPYIVLSQWVQVEVKTSKCGPPFT